ncbi:MAG: hypothetical protein HYR63_18650 [Proteobacteria bacterium]|nr:hypothetical protein [Pseudomonadota bacterium]MBI3499443.1 hypothetical protein [Pseudomonadota bacterium]
MSPEFLRAVLDTLMPGEATAASEGALPAASACGVDLAPRAGAHAATLDAIATEAGGAERFLGASPEARIATMRAVEQRMPEAFRFLVLTVLQDYYEMPAVIRSLGWRIEPPQPRGHRLIEADEATWQLLERVKQRGRLWR